MGAKVYDLGSFRPTPEAPSDFPALRMSLENWWLVYDEMVENLGFMPEFMVLKIMSACRERFRDDLTRR